MDGKRTENARNQEYIHRYIIVKCYIGFCTPRRTEMEFKKKKKKSYGKSPNWDKPL